MSLRGISKIVCSISVSDERAFLGSIGHNVVEGACEWRVFGAQQTKRMRYCVKFYFHFVDKQIIDQRRREEEQTLVIRKTESLLECTKSWFD